MSGTRKKFRRSTDQVGKGRKKGKRKSALDFSVQDASAALPQNCQTTTGY
jgi:hypothetical protein